MFLCFLFLFFVVVVVLFCFCFLLSISLTKWKLAKREKGIVETILTQQFSRKRHTLKKKTQKIRTIFFRAVHYSKSWPRRIVNTHICITTIRAMFSGQPSYLLIGHSVGLFRVGVRSLNTCQKMPLGNV